MYRLYFKSKVIRHVSCMLCEKTVLIAEMVDPQNKCIAYILVFAHVAIILYSFLYQLIERAPSLPHLAMYL